MPQDITWDGSQVVLTLDGEVISPTVDGDFVSVTFNGDYSSMVVGLDGSSVLNLLSDRSGTLDINVRQGTRGSVILDGLRRRYEAKTPPFKIPVGIKVVLSGEQWLARTAALQSAAPPNFGQEAGTETWTLSFNKLEGDRKELPE